MNKLLKLDFNERCDKPSPLIAEYPYGDDLWLYPERQALEKKIAALNNVSPSQVLCTNGGDEAIMLLMRIIKETAQLILPLPAFSQYTWGLDSWKLDNIQLPGNSDLSINVTETLKAINTTPNAVVVITRPNNPTGEVISLTDLLTIIESAKANNSWVFLDEAYIEFSQTKSVAEQLLNDFDNVVVLRTLSKAYGLAGIRLGYLLGSESLIQAFTQRCLPFNVPQPSLQIAQQALTSENREEVDEYCQVIIKNRQQISQWLQSNNIKVLPSEANFLMLKLPLNQAIAIKSFLAKNNLLVRSFNIPELAGCLRITIPYEIDRLMTLLKQTLVPELICLDMDGVLIDTSSSYDETIKATVKKMADILVSQEEIYQYKDSGGFNNDWVLTQEILKQKGFDYSLEAVTEVFQQLYLGDNNDGFVANEKPLINQSLINRINQVQKCQFSIVTGRPRNEADAGQALLGLSQLPSVSLDDVKQPKPSPEGIRKLQCKYSNFSWMCGDNPDDMQAANGSNSLAIGIGKRNAAALYQAGADVVVKSINELEEWLCPIK